MERRAPGSLGQRGSCGVVGLSACGILDVQTQSQITEDALQLPQNADLIVNGAVSDFECALGAYTVGMSLLSDEFESAGAPPSSSTGTGGRRTRPTAPTAPAMSREPGFLGTWKPISTARFTADNALALLNGGPTCRCLTGRR